MLLDELCTCGSDKGLLSAQLTCPYLAIGILPTADTPTANDGQLALGQAVHVCQGCSGQVIEGFATQAASLCHTQMKQV